MKIIALLCSTVGIIAVGLGPPLPAEAGGLGKSIGKAAIARAMKRDLKRHAKTAAKPLTKPRLVHRYTSSGQARREARSGLAPNTHMTVRARRGRPLNPSSAQQRYGLPRRPQVRETIYLGKGFAVRHNKAQGGRPGVGELTAPSRIPPNAVRKTVPLRSGK